MLTGLHEGSFAGMQLGAGVFLRDFDFGSARDAAQLRTLIAAAIREKRGLIGATRGGGTFRCVPKLRSVVADGHRSPVKGGMVCDGWDVTLTGTMLEINPGSFTLALACAEVSHEGGRTTVRLRGAVHDADYVDRVCWVGDTARGLVLIELTNVLNTGGAVFAFGDEREGSLPFTLQAHSLAPGEETAPCRVVFFEEDQDAAE